MSVDRGLASRSAAATRPTLLGLAGSVLMPVSRWTGGLPSRAGLPGSKLT